MQTGSVLFSRFTIISYVPGGALRYLFRFYAIFRRFHANFGLSPLVGANFSEAKISLVLNIYAT